MTLSLNCPFKRPLSLWPTVTSALSHATTHCHFSLESRHHPLSLQPRVTPPPTVTSASSHATTHCHFSLESRHHPLSLQPRVTPPPTVTSASSHATTHCHFSLESIRKTHQAHWGSSERDPQTTYASVDVTFMQHKLHIMWITFCNLSKSVE